MHWWCHDICIAFRIVFHIDWCRIFVYANHLYSSINLTYNFILMVVLPMPCWRCCVISHGMAVPSDACTHPQLRRKSLLKLMDNFSFVSIYNNHYMFGHLHCLNHWINDGLDMLQQSCHNYMGCKRFSLTYIVRQKMHTNSPICLSNNGMSEADHRPLILLFLTLLFNRRPWS